MEVLKTENITYTYSKGTPYEKCAVNDVSISLKKGEIICIIGHTGSGKSTLIQHFNGLIKPDSGKIFIDGEDIFKDKKTLNRSRFKVGLVFQYPEYQLFEETVEKDIAYGPSNMKLSAEEIKQNVYEAAKMVGLSENLMEKSPFELSGGQKRRVAIAGVIAMKPKILVLDEPTAGLDPRGRDDMYKMLLDYHWKTESTIIMVLHSMEDAAKIADRILVMNKSEVFCFDTPENVFKQSEELEKIGLDVPQITKTVDKLREKGIDLGKGIYTVEQAEKVVKEYIKRKKEMDEC